MHAFSPSNHSTTKRLAAAGILACLSAFLVIAVSPAAATAGQTRGLQSDLDALVAGGAPGAILLVRDRHGTKRLTAGVADIATGRPIHHRDRYRIASLAKTYVAAVVLQLVGEHKLRLSDSVERWLPGLVPNGENILIRHLLGHTSGLFDFEDDPRLVEPYLSGNLSFYWSPLERLALATSHEPLYPPGETTASTYSNTNYTVLGLIVEAVTGKSLENQLRRRIFEPLDLDATTYPDRETVIEGRHARGYFLLGPPPLVDVTEFSPSITGAGGAIVSTVGEVARFYRALLKGRLLRPDLLRTMKTTLPAGSDPGAPVARYGLGLEQYATSCGTAWGHSGSFPGYWNYTFSSRSGKRQMVLMVNIDPNALPSATVQRFYDLLDKAYCSTS
jgi:D-alanyl-D-alanine carboxypeptidase